MILYLDMNNKVDYFLHKSFEPTYYQRRFENDLPKTPEEESTSQKTKRAFLIALPFLSLYRPFGSALSLSMGTLRFSTKMIEVLDADSLPDGAHKIMQLGLATLAVIGTLYNFTLGMMVTTGADFTYAFVACVEHLLQNEQKLAAEEFLQMISSLLYLGIMVYGSLEIIIASILLQAIVTFYQAYKEWDHERLPEALAKTIMGMVRLYQANGQYQMLKRRNELVKQYEDFVKRIEKGRDIDHLWDHPVIKGSIEGKTLEDANGVEYDFGDNVFGVGKQLVKGMNVNFMEKDGKVYLQFKVGHVFRKKLEEMVSEMRKAKGRDFQDLLGIFGSRVKGIDVSEKKGDIGDFLKFAKEYDIHLQGLGHIRFGASEEVHTLHTRVTVEMDKGVNFYNFHEALAFMELDDALRMSAKEDFERMKLGHLFHLFSPREATLFVREEDYYDLPLDQFKEEILKRSPKMNGVFEKWLDRISFRETLPGKMRLTLDGLGEEIEKAGAWGLTAGLMGAWTQKELQERIASILKMGMISSESRNNAGIGRPGLSWGADYLSGGADSVFTQMVSDKNTSFKDFAYDSNARIHFSPKVFETGTYQYHSDNYGTRKINDWWSWWGGGYLERPEPFDFIDGERAQFRGHHEVMIKDRIPPEWITGISVKNEALKKSLLDYFRENDVVQKDANGNETILGKLVDQFIWVGSEIHKEQFA